MSLIIYPLIDLLRVFIIRISNKKSPFSPDQNHIHHLLLKKGYSHFKIVLTIQLISLIFLALVEITVCAFPKRKAFLILIKIILVNQLIKVDP